MKNWTKEDWLKAIGFLIMAGLIFWSRQLSKSEIEEKIEVKEEIKNIEVLSYSCTWKTWDKSGYYDYQAVPEFDIKLKNISKKNVSILIKTFFIDSNNEIIGKALGSGEIPPSVSEQYHISMFARDFYKKHPISWYSVTTDNKELISLMEKFKYITEISVNNKHIMEFNGNIKHLWNNE